MASVPTESLCASLTADMIRRPRTPDFAVTLRRIPRLQKTRWRDDAQLFAATWAGGFVFFLTFLG